jgi:hypothetical protein
MRALRALAMVTFVWASTCASLPASATGYVFIRNQKNPTTTLNKQTIRSLFTGQTKQCGGAVVQTVVGEKESEEFGHLAAVFGTGPSELLAKIKQEVFRGEMRRPVLAHTPSECIAAVAQYAGGIGIIPDDLVKTLPPTVTPVAVTE